MATPQLSPGIITREVDLTVGRADNVLANVGAIAGPFSIGPVEQAIDIVTEQQLINTFGKPISTDTQYEYWMSASSFLTYGGVLKVARVDGASLNNSNAGVGAAYTTVAKVKNYDDYNLNWSSDSVNFTYSAKNPGTWSNSLKVCFIDDLADQVIGITTTSLNALGAAIGYGVTTALTGSVAGVGTVTTLDGYLKGIITGVSTDATNGNSTISVKIVSRVSGLGTETLIDYAESNAASSFQPSNVLSFVNNSGITSTTTTSATTVADWYNQQTLGLTNSTIYWKQIAPKPITNAYSANRNGQNDAMHVVVVDDTGSITGVQGNILEKHISISKSTDAVSAVNSPQKIWYKNYLADFSNYVYAGRNPSSAADGYWGTTPRATGFSTSYTPYTTAQGLWGQSAQGIVFSAIGNVTYSLTGGVDYSSSGGMTATLGDLSTAYDLFANKDEIQVNFLIGGPGLTNEFDSQAKANKLISIAESRKDCVSVISPHRANVVDISSTSLVHYQVLPMQFLIVDTNTLMIDLIIFLDISHAMPILLD
jgi:hypothetical protein